MAEKNVEKSIAIGNSETAEAQSTNLLADLELMMFLRISLE